MDILKNLSLDMHQGINTVTEKVVYSKLGVPILQSKHITKGYLNLDDAKYLSEDAYLIYKEKYQPKIDDVLVCNIGTIGASLRVSNDKKFLIAWNLFLIKLDSKKLDSQYFAHYLSYLNERNYFERLSTGGTVKFINKKTMENVPVPTPSLIIQKQIADVLDKADALRKKDQQLLQKYDELTQAIFNDMFGDPVINEKGWVLKTVREIADNKKHSIKAGPFGSSLKKEFYVKSGYKIYGQEQVIADNLSIGDYYIDGERYEKLKSCKVNANDVLISLVGTYGKIAIVPENFEEGIINPRLMKITLNQKLMTPRFFSFLLRSKQVKDQLAKHSRGGTMDIINVGIMSELKLIVPPLSLQNNFVRLFDNIQNQINTVLDVNKFPLYDSIIQKAFNGELVN